MARSVYEGMQAYLARLEPAASEVDKRKSHRKTIEQALAGEFGGFNKVEVIGSHTRETAVHIHSDVDYFAMIGIDDVTRGGSRVTSTTTLNRTKSALQSRFPQTEVWIDGPAVVIGFGQGLGAVDVVPGTWSRTTDSAPKYPVYKIPDGAGGWLETSPQRHAKYIREADEMSGWKLSKVIRLLKGWKYARSPSIPLLGFHLELLLASEAVCVGVRTYQQCLVDAFAFLRDRGGAALSDPLGISGRIPAVATDAQRATLTNAARYAAEKATSAVQAEEAGYPQMAFDFWKLVFNHQFPSR